MATREPHRATEDPSRALWREYRRTGDRALRDRLVLTFAPLAKAVAYRKLREMPPHADVEDYVSCGIEAVIHAIERFDPRRGATLEQYVWTRVHGAVLDEMRRQDWAPRSVRRWERDIQRLRAEFGAVHGRAPRPRELADALGLPMNELRRREREIARAPVASLNVAIAAEDDVVGDRLGAVVDPDPCVDPLAAVTAEASQTCLHDAIQGLPARERLVAVLLYVERLTMAEAGQVIGVSESRISQLHRALMGHLRDKLEADRALFVGSAG
jgi:RNA polymerase sigma factor FliA